MQLDKMIIALRQRTPWEAMDLGVMLMRRLWPVIFFPWLIMMTLVVSFSMFALYSGFEMFSSIIIWWIKPIYDSMLLYIISRSIFAEYDNTSEVYSSMSQWLKTGILTSVFFWRLSPARSFNMPVHLLEGLNGEARKKRLQSLHRVGGSHAMGVTVMGIHFEYLLLITLFFLLALIMPDTSSEIFEKVFEESDDLTSFYLISILIYSLSVFILEPFYVAAGFMLYLNRRSQLEGWDIELDFRKLVQRIKQQTNSSHSDTGKRDNHA